MSSFILVTTALKQTRSNNNPIYEEENTSLLEENMGQMLSVDFGDLDGDGDLDLLVGDFNGFIKYFENISFGNNIIFTFIGNVGSIDLSGNSVPTLGDLDGDGDLDLLIGQTNGTLAFYYNVGSPNTYDFIEEETIFSDIITTGNSAPELLDVDMDGDLDLLLGTAYDGILFFRNTGDGTSFEFILDSAIAIPYIGIHSKPTMEHLFSAEIFDLIVGISTGGLYHIQLELDSCSNMGDLNGDSSYNVLDIVSLVNCILDQSCSSCAGDLNGDSSYNVLDIVALSNCILAQDCGL